MSEKAGSRTAILSIRRAIAVTVAVAAWCAAGPPAAAGVHQWTPIGPPGGTFSSVAGAPSDPTTVYAATSSGVIWRSSDGGATWELVGFLGGAPQLAVDPSQSTTVYASNVVPGTWKSIDGGATWRPLTPGVTAVAIAPGAPQILYGTLLEAEPGGLAVETSADAGASWRVAGLLPQGWQAAELAVDPTDAATVYALGETGVTKSTDGGTHWTLLFSPYASGDVPIALIVDPRNPATLYIACEHFRSDGAAIASIWRSGDGGVSWTEADAGLPQALNSLALAPSGSLYTAALVPSGTLIFASADRGATWQQTAALASSAEVAAGPQTPDRLFALTDQNGLLGSLDQGHTWGVPASPPSGAFISQILSGPAPSGELYVAKSTSVFESEFLRSPDGGATWIPLASVQGQRLVLDAQPGRLYVAPSFFSGPALFSIDDGASWQVLPMPGVQTGLDLAANPAFPGKLVELTCAVSNHAPHSVGCTSYSFYRSNTFGQHWRLLATLQRGGQAPENLVRLDPADPTTAYAIINYTVFKTTAGRTHPRPLQLPFPVTDLAVDPATPSTLYAAIGARRLVFKSTDGGASWAPASFGLPRGALSPVLAIDPIHPSTLYLGTSQGVFVSDDGADTWQPLSDGLVGLGVSSLAISTLSPNTIFAGTPNAGAFSLNRR
jgi:photosystem II stability/assembly factor-like uncharacterized protein